MSVDAMLRASTVSEYALIRVLAFAQRRDLDPATLVSQLAMDFPGDAGRRMAQFASLLSEGYSVVDALQLVRGVVSPSLVLALRLASETGSLSHMYETLLADSSDDDLHANDWFGRLGSELLRTVFVILFACVIISFLATWILPTFTQIFEEFGLELPALLMFIITMSHYVPFLLVIAVALIVALLIWQAPLVEVSLLSRLKPSAAGGRYVAPPARLLSLLSIAAQSQRPLVSALATLGRYHPVAGIRRRLDLAAARINRGEEPWKSLAAERLISTREATALSQTSSGRTQALLLRWRATLHQSRYSLRTHVVIRSLSILATLALAIFVGLVAISVFMVLSTLIAGLA